MPAAVAPNGNDQPVLAIGGLIVDATRLESLTQDFLTLKGRWYPGLNYSSNRHLDRIIPEVKGADLRRNATRGSRNRRRHAIGVLDHVMHLLKHHDVRLVARIWIKALGQPFDGRKVYTSSIQALYSYFDHYLTERQSFGFCIADSRDYLKNVNVAHSIFTQKFRMVTPTYARVLELPTFGHSDNHALLQLCDIVCSALLFPIAAEAYCMGYIANVHAQPDAAAVRQRFGTALKAMQHRYQEPTGRWTGGIVVADAIQRRGTGAMFRS